jgi:hypothetical protein
MILRDLELPLINVVGQAAGADDKPVIGVEIGVRPRVD